LSAAAKAVSFAGLKRRALSLGAVKAFDHAMQFLLPVILVRTLDAATFGEYRLLWLAIGTLMAVSTLNMAGGLYFFLPRSEPRLKRLYIHHTLVFYAAAGLLCAWAVSGWNPWLPGAMKPLAAYGALVPAFVALWIALILIDYLPTIEEQIPVQAKVTVGLSLLRVVLVGGAAAASGDMRRVLWALLALVLFKLALLLYYIHRRHGLGRPWLDRRLFAAQLRYTAPFGLSNALYSLRGQTDQWVAASLFALHSFAAFSIAAVLAPLVYVFRHSVLEAFLPSMSRLEAAGDVRGMLEMSSRGNVLVASLIFPALALAFGFADDLISVIYTPAYLDAAPVMRVYVLGMAAMVIEVGSVLLLLRQGRYALGVNTLALAVSATVSLCAASRVGLAGAAAGSVAAVYLERCLTLRRIVVASGIALRDLQDWPALARAFGSSALAAALAVISVDLVEPSSPPLARLLTGGAILGLAYLGMNLACRKAR
jgi:O-antigen/teichoic acid export membrane protein